MNKIIIGTLSVLLIFFASCTNFEKYESATLESAPTIELKTETVKDSSVVVSFTSSATGFLSFALLEGVSNEKPDSTALIELNVTALELGSEQVTEAGQIITHEFTGLEQNTVYEVFAVSQNDDGVLSAVPAALMIKTTDIYTPVLTSVTPGTSIEADKDSDFEVVLTFDEPIGAADASKFTFEYLNEETSAKAESAEVDPENPYNVIVTQSREGHAGDYVFLSYSEGAVSDIVENPVAALASGVDDEGAPVGLYWRIAKESWAFEVEEFAPEAGTAFSDQEFVIDFEAPVSITNSDNLANGSVRLITTSAGVMSVYQVPAENVILDENGTSITVVKPFVPTFGEKIYFEISAGVFTDKYGNPNTYIESGIDGVGPEGAEAIVIDWLISYGYTIDMVLGNYNVVGDVQWPGYGDEEFDVEITQHPDDPDKVLITGIYYSENPIEAIFNGDFATLTIVFADEDDVIELGDIWGDGASNIFYPYEGLVIEMQIDADGNMYSVSPMAFVYVGADGPSWNNLYWESAWTKIPADGGSLKGKPIKNRTNRLPLNTKF